MKLVSTTLTGNNEDVIGAAIASVAPWVDAVVVVDTGVTDRSLEIAKEVAGDKYVEAKFSWNDSFSDARNFALQAAADAGGDWAVMVDTDETIDTRGEPVRSTLEGAQVGHFMIYHESGTYMQPRFFKLPARARFGGPVHEAYPQGRDFLILEKCIFRDKPKTPEKMQQKFERDARILSAYTMAHPTEQRWFYYLGDALQNLKDLDGALSAYHACAELRGWDEESAWACYRAAECWCSLGNWIRAVEECAVGLSRHSGIAELAWLAAYASFRGGRAVQAVWWAQSSIALGCYKGIGDQVRRISFRNRMALFEGPYDVLRFAYKVLGEEEAARQAQLDYDAAREKRLRG